MKEIIAIIDEDLVYAKKFCNQAMKIYGKKYIFLNFKTVKDLKEYSSENKINSLLTTEEFLKFVDEIKCENIYILNENNKKTKREGKKTFIYKIQSIKEILGVVDANIEKENSSKNPLTGDKSKITVFYSSNTIKGKIDFIKKIAKQISKKEKVLILDIDEFNNYKGTIGLSNIIFNYKENNISFDNLSKEVITDKNFDVINSVTYPEDFNVVTNIDIANIVNELRLLNYNHIFVNADCSYIKSQYIMNDANKIIIFKNQDADTYDKIKRFFKEENQIDVKKITEFDTTNKDKNYINGFVKNCIEDK